MANLQYLNFDLSLERAGEGHYLARVVHSPAGSATHTFALPFSPVELENFCLKIGRPRRGIRRVDSPEMAAAKTFGKKLFVSVFDRELMGCWRSSLDQAEAKGMGLRLRLRLHAPELIDLPWEYLYYPALNRFLVWAVETPLVRFVDLPQPMQPLAVAPPLRILAMISNPVETSGLDVEHEWEQLNAALEKLIAPGLVELERLSVATLSALHAQLRRGPYHIFHFIGHGVFDEQAQDGMLLLEDEQGRGQRVSGQKLGMLLHNHRQLRLAVLNACEGARVARSDPFAGAALSLVQQGIPAVIAMQFEITDVAAITFAREFYRALADGYPVDSAMVEARTGIYALGNDVEWGTPVLYLHAPDGRIFAPSRLRREDSRTAQFKALLQEGIAAARKEEWDAALAIFEQVLALDPQHLEAQRMYKLAQEKKSRAEQLLKTPPAPAVKVAPPMFEVRKRIKKLATNFTNFVDADLLPARRRKRLRAFVATAFAFIKKRRELLLAVLATLGVISTVLKLAEDYAEERSAERENRSRHLLAEGDSYFFANDFSNAKIKYEEAWEQNPEDETIADKLARCEHMLLKTKRADWHQSLHKKYRGEGDSLFTRGQYAEAKQRYQEARAENPNDAYVAERIRLCEQRLAAIEQEKEGERLYSKCVARARAMMAQNDFNSAKQLYLQALRYKSNDAFAVQQIRLCENRLRESSAQPAVVPQAPLGMVHIPSGVFLMGNIANEADEQPLREAYIDGFYLDKHEVTVEQYQLFLSARPAQRKPDYWIEQLEWPQHPVVYVSWEDAAAYCRWRSQQAGARVRLPTEAEWEYAGRGGLGAKKYPWGDFLNDSKANFDASNERAWEWESAQRYLKDVGSYPINGFGVFDMAGNVWEWCADWHDATFYQNRPRPDRNPQGPAKGSERVLRGGSWFSDRQNLRCANRNKYAPATRAMDIGFRCVQERRAQ